jgi:hypothetical protein
MAKIRAYAKTTGAAQSVPESWLDHPVLGANLRRTPVPVDNPTGAPDETWTVPQLTDHAEANGVDLTGLTRKAEILAAIHNPNQAPATGDKE